MKRMVLVALALMGLVPGSAFAGGEVFDFSEELTKGYQRPAFRAKELVRTPEYTVAALAVKEEIKMHQHPDASHVLYIVSGQGVMTLDGKPVTLKPGMVIHIPKGVLHNVKAEGGEVMFLDFSAHTSSNRKEKE